MRCARKRKDTAGTKPIRSNQVDTLQVVAQNDAMNAVANEGERGEKREPLEIETREKGNGTHSVKFSSTYLTRNKWESLTFDSGHDNSQHRGVGGGCDARQR